MNHLERYWNDFKTSNHYKFQANYKINAMKIMFDLHTLKQRRAYMNMRTDIEEQNRREVEREVRKLREKISDLKVQITSITKGVPISQFDVLGSRERRKSDADASDITPESSDMTIIMTSDKVVASSAFRDSRS